MTFMEELLTQTSTGGYTFLLSSYFKGAIYGLDSKSEVSILFQDENLISPAAIAINAKKIIYMLLMEMRAFQKNQMKQLLEK